MSEPVLRLAVLLTIFFSCVAAIELAIYLSVVVFNLPLLAFVPIAAVLAFLIFVGRRNLLRTHRRFLDSAE